MDKPKFNRISTIKKESLELELVDENDEHEHSSSNSFDLALNSTNVANKNLISTQLQTTDNALIARQQTKTNLSQTMTNYNMHNNNNSSNTPNPMRRQSNMPNFRSSMEFYRLKLSRSKLKAISKTSALLSGFAMVAMVELGLNYSDYFEAYIEIKKQSDVQSELFPNTNGSNVVNSSFSTHPQNLHDKDFSKKYLIPESILILYALVTCLLVGVHMLALMISTCILPQIEASSFEQMEFEQNLYKYEYNIINQSKMMNKSNVNDMLERSLEEAKDYNMRSRLNLMNAELDIIFPYKKFHKFIELAWISSTVVGIFLFLVEIGLVCYIKFYPISYIAALTGAIVMLPILVLFVLFTVTFYKRVADFKLNITKRYFSNVDHDI